MLSDGSFSVVTVLKESLQTTITFVDWYRKLGAQEIILFFDDPEDPAIEHFNGALDVEAIACDPAFWATIGQRADKKFVKRQNAALNEGYRRAKSQWVLAVDADEYLFSREQRLEDRLAVVDANCRAISVETTELVQCVEDNAKRYFRTPMSQAQITAVYGDDSWMFRRRNGLVGHYQGKSIIRSGQNNIRLRQHWAEDRERNKITDTVWRANDGVYLLHYFGGDFSSWRQKLEWRNEAWGFARYLNNHINRLRDEGADAEIALLYKALHETDRKQLEVMEAEGVLVVLENTEAPAHT